MEQRLQQMAAPHRLGHTYLQMVEKLEALSKEEMEEQEVEEALLPAKEEMVPMEVAEVEVELEVFNTLTLL